jgi:arsenite oxidase large subunit
LCPLGIKKTDARRLGIKSGDLVEVYNLEGNAIALVYVNDAPPPE